MEDRSVPASAAPVVLRPNIRSPRALRQVVMLQLAGLVAAVVGWDPALRWQPSHVVSGLLLVFSFNVLPLLHFRMSSLFVDDSHFGRTFLGLTRTWPLSDFTGTRMNIWDVLFVGLDRVLFTVNRGLWGETAVLQFADVVSARRDAAVEGTASGHCSED